MMAMINIITIVIIVIIISSITVVIIIIIIPISYIITIILIVPFYRLHIKEGAVMVEEENGAHFNLRTPRTVVQTLYGYPVS